MIDFSSGDHFVFDAPLFSTGSGLLNTSADAGQLDIGVNFGSGLAAAETSGDSGWFVYHNDTGVLEWDASGSSAGGDAVAATFSCQFTASGGDFATVDV